MEVNIYNILVKSLWVENYITHLAQAFIVLDQHHMKLNMTYIVFVWYGIMKLLRYLVTQKGIETNPEQIKDLINMSSPKSIKEMQKMNCRITALSQFISKLSKYCISFCRTL